MVFATLALALITQGTPEQLIDQAVRNLVIAIQAKDYSKARSYVKVTSPVFRRTAGADQLEKFSIESGNVWRIKSIAAQRSGGYWMVNIQTQFGVNATDAVSEKLQVQLVGGKVKFLPKQSLEGTGPVGWWVMVLDNDSNGLVGGSFKQAEAAAERTTALKYAKQLGTALQIYAADYDDLLPGREWKEVTTPYVIDEAIFGFQYKGKKYRYSFNTKLNEVNMTKIAKPAKTVMVYVGEFKKLDFVFGQTTPLLYADGHAKFVEKKDAKSLVWNP